MPLVYIASRTVPTPTTDKQVQTWRTVLRMTLHWVIIIRLLELEEDGDKVLAKNELRVPSSQRGRLLVNLRLRKSQWAFNGRRLLSEIQTSLRFIFRQTVLQTRLMTRKVLKLLRGESLSQILDDYCFSPVRFKRLFCPHTMKHGQNKFNVTRPGVFI